MKPPFAIALALVIAAPAQAHEVVSLRELLSGWGLTHPDDAAVTSENVAPGVYVLKGLGGNVLVSIGEQGVLMVDSQFPEMVPKLQAEIRRLGGGTIDFTINTHWHFDHADGNPMLAREGTWMISHLNSRRMMVDARTIVYTDNSYRQPPYPLQSLPIITFTDRMQLHFNGSRVDVLHFGPAHTSGDAVVILRKQNVVHMGDVLNSRYPFIDAENGGDIDGMIDFCHAVLDTIDERTIVVPGHGAVSDRQALVDFVAMLRVIRTRILALIDDGSTLDDVIAARPTVDFDERYGDPTLFIGKIYSSLSRH